MKTFYEILEVSEKASPEIIEKAYRVLAKKYHPDLQPKGQKEKAEEKMKQINEAYSVLSDQGKRACYDQKLQEQKNTLNEKYQNGYSSQNYRKAENQTQTSYGHYAKEENASYQNSKAGRKTEKEIRQETIKINKELQKKVQAEYEQKYQQAYEDYLRSLGYKIKYKWTWKNYKDLIITLLIISSIIIGLCFFPPTRNWMLEFYESNPILKAIVDVIIKIFVGIWNAVCSIFK